MSTLRKQAELPEPPTDGASSIGAADGGHVDEILRNKNSIFQLKKHVLRGVLVSKRTYKNLGTIYTSFRKEKSASAAGSSGRDKKFSK